MNNLERELGLPKSVQGKTFAEAARYIENLFEGRNDKISLDTKKTFLKRLRDYQEAEKAALQAEAEARMQEAMNAEQMQQMQAQAETVNAVKQSNELALGGIPTQEEITSGILGTTQFGNQQAAANTAWAYKPTFWDKTTGALGKAGRFLGNNATNILGGLGLATATLAPLIYNERAKDELEAPEAINAYTISPGVFQENLVNRQQIERNLANQAASSRYAASTAAGGDAGALMNTFTGIGTGTANALANAMLSADMADAQEKARVQGQRANVLQSNARQQMRADEINAANRAAYEDLRSQFGQAQAQSLTNMGTTLFNYMQSRNYVDALRKAMQFKNI